MEKAEEWRPVVGQTGRYEVSNLGRVRSLDRTSEYRRGDLVIRRRHKGILLSPGDCMGYPSVQIGRESRRTVHRLVCQAFHGEPAPGQEVLHKDGDRKNPRADNLRWGTRKENVADMRTHGTARIGERGTRAILSEAQALEIRAALIGGTYPGDLAGEYGVSVGAIADINMGTNWKHLGAAPKLIRGTTLTRRGERQHLSKLTGDKVREMRALHAGGESAVQIAKRYGVGHRTAWQAVTRRTWKHID